MEGESPLASRKPTLGQHEVIILPCVPLVNFFLVRYLLQVSSMTGANTMF